MNMLINVDMLTVYGCVIELIFEGSMSLSKKTDLRTVSGGGLGLSLGFMCNESTSHIMPAAENY